MESMSPIRLLMIAKFLGEIFSAGVLLIAFIIHDGFWANFLGGVCAIILGRLLWYYLKWYIIQWIEDFKKFVIRLFTKKDE